MSRRSDLANSIRQRAASSWKPLVVCVALAWCAFGGGARAEPSLGVTPSELSLAPGIPQDVFVTLSGTAAELRGADLQVIPPPGLRTKNVAPGPRAKGSKGWVLTVEADGSLGASAAAIVARTPQRLITGSLKVSPVAAAAANAQFAAELAFDGDSLLDESRGDVALRLTNLSTSKLSLTSHLRLPDFLSTLCSGKPCPPPTDSVTLPPGASTVFDYRIEVRADGQHPLVTGKHQLSAVVEAKRLEAALPWQGSQIVSREVTVGIPGLGEVQTLVQVPSFLLLPGFLCCVVAMMAWRFICPSAGVEGRLAAWTTAPMSPPIWVLAISLSMLAVWAYPYLTAFLAGGQRNLLRGFDLSDVLLVWVTSIGVGFIAGAVAALVAWIRKWLKDRDTFEARDTPLAALRKMARLKLKLELMLSDQPATGRLFRLCDAAEPGKVWAIPRIVYEPSGTFDINAFLRATSTDAAAQVIPIIERGGRSGGLALRWGAAPGGDGPRVVDGVLFDRRERTALIFEPA